MAVLHDLQRDLVLDLIDAEAGRRLVLDDETLNLIIAEVSCPDDGNIAPGSVADPPLLAVEDPSVPVALCGRRQAAGGAGTYERLREPEPAHLLETGHWRQPLLLLFFRSLDIDRAHCQSFMHTLELRN